MSQYTIKDLEHLSGIKAHTLRIWEQRYSILSPKRTQTNIRFYDSHDLKRVLNISVLNDHGFKISRIARMSGPEMHQQVVSLSQDFCHFPDQIQNLTLALVDMDETRFERCMTTNIQRVGLERTMIEIVYPFLSRIGTLWQTGAINPAQEHFITNLIRQKLIVAIDRQSIIPTAATRHYTLFLPEGDLHELGLLFACYLIKSRNHRVTYLGQSLPVEDLISACKAISPDFVMGIFTLNPSLEVSIRYLERLLSSRAAPSIMLTGPVINDVAPYLTESYTQFHTIQNLIQHLDAK